MEQEILKIVAEETGKEVTLETKTEELGLDSLEFVDLLLTIQQATGIEIPDHIVAHISTVGDIVKASEGTLVTV